MRICLVKQRNCYDLYTTLSPNVGVLARSSNLRSGPLALWEFPGAEVDFRIVEDCLDSECRLGERLWAHHVEGWDYRRWEGHAATADSVDWSAYDIVISIDVSVPERAVRLHPHTLWCYIFIEGGPKGQGYYYSGEPQHSYNVFLNDLPATRLLTAASSPCVSMALFRRAVLHFPYYLLSDTTLSRIYASRLPGQRSGTCVASTSRDLLSPQLALRLGHYGPLRRSYETAADFHSDAAASKYFVVLPGSPRRAGGALVDAVSAGCVVLAPKSTVTTYRSFLLPELDFSDDEELIRCLDAMETDPALYRMARSRQAEVVRLQFCQYPLENLARLWGVFRAGRARPDVQHIAERVGTAAAPYLDLPRRVRSRLRYRGDDLNR